MRSIKPGSIDDILGRSEVLAVARVSSADYEAPLSVVLRIWEYNHSGKPIEWVVHTFNHQSRGFENGNYRKNLVEAYQVFLNKVAGRTIEQ